MLVGNLLPTLHAGTARLKPGAPLLEAARLLGDGHCMVLVCDDAGTLVGIVTKADVVRQTGRCEGANCCAAVSSAMVRDVVTTGPQTTLQEIWQVMNARGLRKIPVLDAQSRPLGVLRAHDVLVALLAEVHQEEELLRNYAMNLGYR